MQQNGTSWLSTPDQKTLWSSHLVLLERQTLEKPELCKKLSPWDYQARGVSGIALVYIPAKLPGDGRTNCQSHKQSLDSKPSHAMRRLQCLRRSKCSTGKDPESLWHPDPSNCEQESDSLGSYVLCTNRDWDTLLHSPHKYPSITVAAVWGFAFSLMQVIKTITFLIFLLLDYFLRINFQKKNNQVKEHEQFYNF